MASPGLRLVAGCYDGSLHGWIREDGRAPRLEFAFPAHVGALRVTAYSAKGRWLATGGSDDSIKIFDVERLREHGTLQRHTDAVTALAFAGSTHLLSGGSDGQLLLWRVRDWECVHTLVGHKPGPVTSIAVHPTCKVALSTSRDRSLRLWDLVGGSAATRLAVEQCRELGQACWSPLGGLFAVVGDGRNLLIYSVDAVGGVEDGEPIAAVEHPSRINGVAFLDEERVATGDEAGQVRIIGVDGAVLRDFGVSAGAASAAAAGRTMRVRAVAAAHRRDAAPLLAVAMGDGRILAWDAATESTEEKPELSVRCGTGAHLTCLAVLLPPDARAAEEQEAEEQSVDAPAAEPSRAQETQSGPPPTKKAKKGKKKEKKEKKKKKTNRREKHKGNGSVE